MTKKQVLRHINTISKSPFHLWWRRHNLLNSLLWYPANAAPTRERWYLTRQKLISFTVIFKPHRDVNLYRKLYSGPLYISVNVISPLQLSSATSVANHCLSATISCIFKSSLRNDQWRLTIFGVKLKHGWRFVCHRIAVPVFCGSILFLSKRQ